MQLIRARHRSKGRVSRCIQEGNLLTIFPTICITDVGDSLLPATCYTWITKSIQRVVYRGQRVLWWQFRTPTNHLDSNNHLQRRSVRYRHCPLLTFFLASPIIQLSRVQSRISIQRLISWSRHDHHKESFLTISACSRLMQYDSATVIPSVYSNFHL